MINKCKCRKDVLVVVIDSSTPYGGNFCDFLKELSPEKRCKYTYVPFYANTSTEAWVDKLKCKLQQLCKRNCRKPNVLSTLFDTNLEILLARVQACANCFYLTHSTYEVNSVFACFKTLPAGPLNKRTNRIYQNDFNFTRLVIADKDVLYEESLLSNIAERNKLQIISNEEINPDQDNGNVFFINTDIDFENMYRYAKKKSDVSEAPTLSDKVLAKILKTQEGNGYIEWREELQFWILKINGEKDKYLKIYSTNNYSSINDLQIILSYAGIILTTSVTATEGNDAIIELSKVKSSAIQFNSLV
jgi:hypothetical protein